MRRPLEKLLSKGRIIEIPLNQISQNPYQARTEFDERYLRELAMSIRAYGVIQPIIVRRSKEGFQLIAGERRYRACKMIGRRSIPCIIQEMDDEQAAAVSLIENLQRRELNYFEEASAYLLLMNEFGMTQEELAQKIGRSQSAIANKLRLLKLPDEVRAIMLTDTISERHARSLLKLNSADMQKEVVRQIYDKALTVKETEELVEKLRENNIPAAAAQPGMSNSVSMIIRDARIFINTIKETVNRARQTGINMRISEMDREDEYQIIIHIPKVRGASRSIS